MDAITQLKTLINSMEYLGINPVYIICVVFLTALFKSFDTRNKFKQGYIFFPFVSSLLILGIMRPSDLPTYTISALIHAAVGAYGYKIWASFFKRKKASE